MKINYDGMTISNNDILANEEPVDVHIEDSVEWTRIYVKGYIININGRGGFSVFTEQSLSVVADTSISEVLEMIRDSIDFD